MPNPFTLPAAPESQWSARDHQAAANFYYYEMQGYSEAEYQAGRCDANYKPMQSMMRAAFANHQRKAAALRATTKG